MAELNPHRHIILYAKGYYNGSNSMYGDVTSILRCLFPEEDVTPEKVITVLSIIAFQAIATSNKDVVIKKDTIIKNLSGIEAFREMIMFMWKARDDIYKKFPAIDDAVEELIVEGMLTVIACHPYEKDSLGQIESNVQGAIYARA